MTIASDPIILRLFEGFSESRVELVAELVAVAVVLGGGYVWRRAGTPVESEI